MDALHSPRISTVQVLFFFFLFSQKVFVFNITISSVLKKKKSTTCILYIYIYITITPCLDVICLLKAAMEHVLSRHSGDYDEDLFKRVRHWYEELDKRMGMLKHCKMIKGQGWDGECLSIDNWWNSVRYKERLDKPWNGR